MRLWGVVGQGGSLVCGRLGSSRRGQQGGLVEGLSREHGSRVREGCVRRGRETCAEKVAMFTLVVVQVTAMSGSAVEHRQPGSSAQVQS